MKTFNRLILAIMFVVTTGIPAYADLELIDPDVRDKQLAQAEELYAKQDVDALLKLLKESHLVIKQDIALKLGRLGADKALSILRHNDQSYSRFACAPSGQFGVAVILIENRTADAQKQALLAVATEPQKKSKHPYSVVDVAGRELSRYEGDDIIKAVVDIGTNGAQYTVLKLQCKKLSESDAISKCIAVLEEHVTPPKAEAAEQLLIAFGSNATMPVKKLRMRVEKRIKSTDPTFTIPKTIRSRCNKIITQIERDEKANKVDPEHIVQKCFDNIRNKEGRYFDDVFTILNAEGGVPALIPMLKSTNQQDVFQAYIILSRISVRLSESRTLDSDLPKDATYWTTWWETTGSTMSSNTMMSNFGSHWK